MGTYQAQYDGFTGEETVFGGTALERDAGNEAPSLYPLTLRKGRAGAVPEWGQSAGSALRHSGIPFGDPLPSLRRQLYHRAGRKCDRFHPTNGGIKSGDTLRGIPLLCGAGAACPSGGRAFSKPQGAAGRLPGGGLPFLPRNGERGPEEVPPWTPVSGLKDPARGPLFLPACGPVALSARNGPPRLGGLGRWFRRREGKRRKPSPGEVGRRSRVG